MTNLKKIAVAVLAFVIFSNITNAQTVKANYAAMAAEPLNVKYIGEEGDYFLFNVTLQSSNPAKAYFAIYDGAEGELYSSMYKINVKGITVKVEKKGTEQVLNFKMILAGKTYSKSFSANSSTVEKITVADMSITKL